MRTLLQRTGNPLLKCLTHAVLDICPSFRDPSAREIKQKFWIALVLTSYPIKTLNSKYSQKHSSDARLIASYHKSFYAVITVKGGEAGNYYFYG